MKQILILTIISIMCLTASAQRAKESVIGLNVGGSVTGALFRVAKQFTDSDSTVSNLLASSALPPLSISYDYGVSDHFTIGALASGQHLTATVNEVNIDLLDTLLLSEVNAKFNRFYIGLVPRYQYKINSEMLALYSAARVGFVFWSSNVNLDNVAFDDIRGFGVGRPALSIVLLGGRYFFNDNFGLNFELASGAPYLASIGLNYKL